MKKNMILCMALFLAACHTSHETLVKFEGEAQGSYYNISYYDRQQRNLQEEIDSLLDDFDMTASLWKENSLIRQINDNRKTVLNPLFIDLLQKSVEMNRYTNGAFDCTVGQLVNAWGFGFKQRKELDSKAVDSLRMYCGVQPKIMNDTNGTTNIVKPSVNTTIDFNAIAQGYSTDMVAHFLETKGIENYIVNIGGEVFARGSKPDGSSWVIGIERPAKTIDSAPVIAQTIEVNNMAVVTSGNYRKYYEKDGVRYSHTIDPATGYPVKHSLLSVTVVDTAAWRADAIATAFMVMGLEKSLEFIAEHSNDSGMDAVLFIYDENGEYKYYETSGWKKMEK